MPVGPDTQAELLKAVAHPLRLRILAALIREEECVCHLSALLEKPQPYMSQQLAALKEVGLVVDRREAQRVYCRAADPRITDLLRTVAALAGSPEPNNATRHPIAGCSCPKCYADARRGAQPWSRASSN